MTAWASNKEEEEGRGVESLTSAERARFVQEEEGRDGR